VKRLLLCCAVLATAWVRAEDGAALPARLSSETGAQLRALIEAAQQDTTRKPGSALQKIGDFYASYMDAERLERLGRKPLVTELQRIRVLRDRRGLPQAIAHLSQIGVDMPYVLSIHPDWDDGGKLAVHISPGGLGMSLLNYQTSADGKPNLLRDKYLRHIEKMLVLGGARAPQRSAQAALDLETKLAHLQTMRPPQHGPHAPVAVAIDKLGALAPGYDWTNAFGAAGVGAKTDSVKVADPTYLQGFAKLAQETDLESWKAYLEWQLWNNFSPYLTKEFAQAHAQFHGSETPQPPRWAAGLVLVNQVLSDLVGKQYVARHFSAERQRQLQQLVSEQLDACRRHFAAAEVSDSAAHQQALAMLAGLRAHVGYPATWRDTTALTVSPTDLVGNIMRVRYLNHAQLLGRLGKPVDSAAWDVPAQRPEIDYDHRRNLITLPAALLQAPLVAEPVLDAGNYGRIGAAIGDATAPFLKSALVAAQVKHACALPATR
jgi:putative endopeptidase